MGKRSNFEKNPRDYYRTFDPKAGIALKPFVEEGLTYFEPFAGAGDLIKQLDFVECKWASDIEPQQNEGEIYIREISAFHLPKTQISNYDLMITNPPWTKDVFHRSLEHFVPLIDCWFLMSSNWKQNKGSAEYVNKWLTDIVPIGRMKWIEGSPHSSVDDCEWLKFSYWKNDAARFHPRG